jgi:uncharacterized protein YyaL (SSP411 family)
MTNRLIEETSPYLLQHAHNPVDWYPWGPDALDRARTEDRPILLSIGYAACHWCHVMERESFEDEATAALMNEHFVSVKVDREERPDLDAVYMDAVQAMTGSGGWPMTVFLTPDGRPFFAGTYFPPEDRHGIPAFRRVLVALAEAWRDRRDEIVDQGRRVAEALAASERLAASPDPLTEELLGRALATVAGSFDAEWGGFGGAPKFPQPMTLEFVLRAHLRGYEGALAMLTATLDRMAAGGMYDQVGGGFHRYSTDARWHVPHFEKMLYDNAQLLRLYARAWQVTGHERYRQVATETGEYLLREMRHPDGGLFSSQDADSEGVEGRFFVWSWDELLGLVGEEAAVGFGATPEGNWEGSNVLRFPAGAPADLEALGSARRILFDAREARERPATDDKVLSGWNGLAIAGLAEAGRILGQPQFVDAAVAAAEFVLTNLRTPGGRLVRSWREGRTGPKAFADDHAMLAEGLLTLYETTFDQRFFVVARQLADELIRLFADPEHGGFFQTGSDAERLVVRAKDLFDNAVPSANSVAADVLLRLALLTGEASYGEAGESALRLVRPLLARSPGGFGHALTAVDFLLSEPREVAIVGDPSSPDTRALVDVVRARFRPHLGVAVGAPGQDTRVPLMEHRTAVEGAATAYVCRGFVCDRPVTAPSDLADLLDGQPA